MLQILFPNNEEVKGYLMVWLSQGLQNLGFSGQSIYKQSFPCPYPGQFPGIVGSFLGLQKGLTSEDKRESLSLSQATTPCLPQEGLVSTVRAEEQNGLGLELCEWGHGTRSTLKEARSKQHPIHMDSKADLLPCSRASRPCGGWQ